MTGCATGGRHRRVAAALAAMMIAACGSQSGLAQSTANIRVDVNGADTARPQVTYHRGVVVQMNGTSAAISKAAANTAVWVSDADLNVINATVDLNNENQADQFYYVDGDTGRPAFKPAAAQRFYDVFNQAPFSNHQLMVQVSGTPVAFSDKNDTRYKFVCGGGGNFYPVPRLDTADQRAEAARVATAVARWIDYMGTVDIVAGTQEPSHTLGFLPGGTDPTCGASSPEAVQANLNRFATWWKPVASYSFPITSQQRQKIPLLGAMQLNRGDYRRYVAGANDLKAAGARTDVHTIQVYGPVANAVAGLNDLFVGNRQALYSGERIFIDRYGPTSKVQGSNCDRVAAYTRPDGINFFLAQEAMLMKSAWLDDFAGYAIETTAFSQTCTDRSVLVPGVIKWLQAAPAPLRPVNNLPTALKAIALVSKDSARSGYLAMWSTAAADYTVSVTMVGFGAVDGMTLAVTRAGSQGIVTRQAGPNGSVDGITRSGNVVSNVRVAANNFVLISLR